MSSPVKASAVPREAPEPITVTFPTHDLSVERVDLADLYPYPGNPRQGDVGALVKSLQVHGQYRPLIVQRSTSRVLAGNHTMLAARELGWNTLAVSYLDVDDEQAARIVAVDNRSSDLASYDDFALADLLKEIADTPAGLNGTGFDGDDLDDLLADLAKSAARDEQGNRGLGAKAIVHYDVIFDDEAQQQDFFDFLRRLKRLYPDEGTVAARLTRFIQTVNTDPEA